MLVRVCATDMLQLLPKRRCTCGSSFRSLNPLRRLCDACIQQRRNDEYIDLYPVGDYEEVNRWRTVLRSERISTRAQYSSANNDEGGRQDPQLLGRLSV